MNIHPCSMGMNPPMNPMTTRVMPKEILRIFRKALAYDSINRSCRFALAATSELGLESPNWSWTFRFGSTITPLTNSRKMALTNWCKCTHN